MNWSQIVGLGAAAVLLFWAIGARNRLMALRNAIGAAWSPLQGALERRRALVDALLAGLRPAPRDDALALDALLAAAVQVSACSDALRARPSAASAAASLGVAEGVFAQAMARVLALIDEHPVLAERPAVAPALAELAEVETQRGFARQNYNAAVDAYNEAVGQFPTRLLTRGFGMRMAGRV